MLFLFCLLIYSRWILVLLFSACELEWRFLFLSNICFPWFSCPCVWLLFITSIKRCIPWDKRFSVSSCGDCWIGRWVLSILWWKFSFSSFARTDIVDAIPDPRTICRAGRAATSPQSSQWRRLQQRAFGRTQTVKVWGMMSLEAFRDMVGEDGS